MNNLIRKTWALVLSMAMMVTSLGFTGIQINAEVSIQTMVRNSTYNLALKKAATANPTKGEGKEDALTDGNLTGDHAATTFNTSGTYYLVDLGKVYEAAGIEKIVVAYKEKNDGDTPVNGYQIQYSADGINFRTVKKVLGNEITTNITEQNLIDIQDVENTEGNVRFVKIYYPNSYTWGIQVRAIAVLDTDEDVVEGTIESCDNPAGITASSDDYNEITYSITAGENQEDYVYVVSLDVIV